MPLQPVQFDQILYVRKRVTRAGVYTDFGFVAQSVAYKGATIPGRQDIAVGQSVVAVLRKKGNWSTLVGWFDNDTGKLVGPDMSDLGLRTFLICSMSSVVAFELLWVYAHAAPSGVPAAGLAILCGAVAVFAFYDFYETRKAWNELVARFPTAPQNVE